MNVTEKYTIDKEYECKAVFKTTDKEHPGVEKVMAQAKYNLAGPIKVLSEIYYPEQFKGLYQRPAESRKIFSDLGWKRIAALQLRNPMHVPTNSSPRSPWKSWTAFTSISWLESSRQGYSR
jgi:sulfate adenylyltransferase